MFHGSQGPVQSRGPLYGKASAAALAFQFEKDFQPSESPASPTMNRSWTGMDPRMIPPVQPESEDTIGSLAASFSTAPTTPSQRGSTSAYAQHLCSPNTQELFANAMDIVISPTQSDLRAVAMPPPAPRPVPRRVMEPVLAPETPGQPNPAAAGGSEGTVQETQQQDSSPAAAGGTADQNAASQSGQAP
jgi:hypothetical protein